MQGVSYTGTDDRILIHEKSLGKGSYGMVCRYRRTTGDTVAVKYMVVSKNGITSLLEASIMSTYIHPNINSSIEIAYARPYFYILQEEAVSDLTDVVQDSDVTSSSYMSHAIEWMKQLNSGLDVLHREQIIHCDIKPDNVLVYNTGVKIADFSHSVIYTGTLFSHDVGTITYKAPEILEESKWSSKIDIWSLGCVFYFMLTGCQLIASQSRDNEHKRVLECIRHWRYTCSELSNYKQEHEFRPITMSGRWKNVHKGLRVIVESMLLYYDHQRPDIHHVMNMFGQERVGYIVRSSLHRIREVSAAVVRMMKTVTSDDAVLRLAKDIYMRTYGMLNTLERIRVETCVWIASKLINNKPPSIKGITSQIFEIIKTEALICETLNYQLHTVL